MFSKKKVSKPTENFSEQIDDLKNKIRAADFLVVGAGARLSTSAGFVYTGERFRRYFLMQGDYGLFQCSEPCCQKTFENEDVVQQMIAEQTDMRISARLLPVCPHCGKPLYNEPAFR